MEVRIKQHTEQLSDRKLREWQRYHGWKIRILEELEHSGGMTTREISSRIGYRCTSTANRLQEMLHVGFVEKIERWGWKITLDGVTCLSINYVPTSYQHDTNIVPTSYQQYVSGKNRPKVIPNRQPQLSESPQEIGTGPVCYQATICHIKRLCHDKRYTLTNQDRVCSTCVYDDFRRHALPWVPVEKGAVGLTLAHV